MKRSSLSPIGGFQPFLFLIGMYVVALFFSIFICSSIFYAINEKPDSAKHQVTKSNNITTKKAVLASLVD